MDHAAYISPGVETNFINFIEGVNHSTQYTFMASSGTLFFNYYSGINNGNTYTSTIIAIGESNVFQTIGVPGPPGESFTPTNIVPRDAVGVMPLQGIFDKSGTSIVLTPSGVAVANLVGLNGNLIFKTTYPTTSSDETEPIYKGIVYKIVDLNIDKESDNYIKVASLGDEKYTPI